MRQFSQLAALTIFCMWSNFRKKFVSFIYFVQVNIKHELRKVSNICFDWYIFSINWQTFDCRKHKLIEPRKRCILYERWRDCAHFLCTIENVLMYAYVQIRAAKKKIASYLVVGNIGPMWIGSFHVYVSVFDISVLYFIAMQNICVFCA